MGDLCSGIARYPKLTCKCYAQARIGKAPPNYRAIGGMRAVAALWLDAVLSEKLVHRIEPCPQTAPAER